MGGAATGAAIGSVVPGIGTAIGGVVGALGSLLSGWLSGADEDAARDKYQQIIRLYGEQAVKAATLARPELEQLVGLQGGSEYANADPATRAMQMDSLGRLRQQAQAGGLDPQALAQLGAARSQADRAYQGRYQGILSDAARRGQSGGPLGYMSALQAAGDTGRTQAEAGVQAAGGAAERGQRANLALGQGASAVRGQDYQRAAAQDSINRYNASLRQAVMQRNTSATNVGRTNAFQGGLAAAGGKAGALRDQAAVDMGDADYGRPAVNAGLGVLQYAGSNMPSWLAGSGGSAEPYGQPNPYDPDFGNWQGGD